MKKSKLTITEGDYIKAMRKANRELEIELHGSQVSHRIKSCCKSKKTYNRNEIKNNLRKSTSDLFFDKYIITFINDALQAAR